MSIYDASNAGMETVTIAAAQNLAILADRAGAAVMQVLNCCGT
jgi:hypothetical protein